MSAIAGAIVLDGGAVVDRPCVEAMLAAMAGGAPAQTHVVPLGTRGAVGLLAYGPCACGPAQANGVHVLLAGECYDAQVSDVPSAAHWLLRRYLQGSAGDVGRGLHGAFSAVIIDGRDGSATVLTDHNGSRPVFRMTHGGVLYFASEVKGIAALAHLPCRLDEAALVALLIANRLMNRRTLMADVEMLAPAVTLHVRDGRVSVEQWRRHRMADAPVDRGLSAFADELEHLLRQAVRRRTRLGRPCILLSGGLDARTIVAFLDDPHAVPAFTYSGRSPGARHPAGDAALAARLAALVGMPHRVITFTAERMLDLVRQSVRLSDGAVPFLMEDVWDELAAQAGSTCVLMGDECFSAASGPVADGRWLEYLGTRPLHECPSLVGLLRPDRRQELLDLSLQECDWLVEDQAGRPGHDVLDELLHRWRLTHGTGPCRQLMRRLGYEVRLPLVDLDVLDFLQTVPAKYRAGKRLVRHVLRRVNPALSRLPRARATEAIDYRARLAELENQGGRITRFVFDDNPLLEEFFDSQAVGALIRRVAEGPAPRRRLRLSDLVPPQVRRFLAANARTVLGMRSPHLATPGELLLRVVTLAETLRHIHGRFGAAGGRQA